VPSISDRVDRDLLAREAAEVAATGGLTFHVEGETLTYTSDGTTVRCEIGSDTGATAVGLSRGAWDDLVGQMRTFVGLLLSDELHIERGGFEQLADWEPVLRYLHAGIPPYDPARATSRAGPGCRLPRGHRGRGARRAAPDHGYSTSRGSSPPRRWKPPTRGRSVASLALPGDDRSWWVTDEAGAPALCRLVYATLRSPLLAALESDPRVRRLGTLLDPTLAIAPDRMEGTPVLIKVPGQTRGLSNIPWHQDCGTGGHAVLCPASAWASS